MLAHVAGALLLLILFLEHARGHAGVPFKKTPDEFRWALLCLQATGTAAPHPERLAPDVRYVAAWGGRAHRDTPTRPHAL